jgi:uncharacterized protein YbjT (DUF2867 family)
VGGRVARRLAEGGVPQRLIVREGGRAPALAGCVPVAATDYGAGDQMRDALSGARTLFLVSGREHPDRLAQHLSAVDAAVAAGVERIVYLSFLNAAADATFTLARQHFATEQHILASGVRFAFLVRACTRTSCRTWPETKASFAARPGKAACRGWRRTTSRTSR